MAIPGWVKQSRLSSKLVDRVSTKTHQTKLNRALSPNKWLSQVNLFRLKNYSCKKALTMMIHHNCLAETHQDKQWYFLTRKKKKNRDGNDISVCWPNIPTEQEIHMMADKEKCNRTHYFCLPDPDQLGA